MQINRIFKPLNVVTRKIQVGLPRDESCLLYDSLICKLIMVFRCNQHIDYWSTLLVKLMVSLENQQSVVVSVVSIEKM